MLTIAVAACDDASDAESEASAKRPNINATSVTLTAGVDVTLNAGDVTLPNGFELGQFSATLLPRRGDSSRVSFTDSDGDGVFELSFRLLIPESGPFRVRLNVPDGLNVLVEPATPTSVSPARGATEELDWTLQSATEAPAS